MGKWLTVRETFTTWACFMKAVLKVLIREGQVQEPRQVGTGMQKTVPGKNMLGMFTRGEVLNVTARPFTDSISISSSFFRKAPGMAFMLRVQTSMDQVGL
jgi:hypothetical protein